MAITDISRISYLEAGVEKFLAGPRAPIALRDSLGKNGNFHLGKIGGRILSVQYFSNGKLTERFYNEYVESIASRTIGS